MLLDIADSDCSGWPTDRQSSGACQSVENGPCRRAASAPTETETNNVDMKISMIGDGGKGGHSSRNRAGRKS